MNQLTPLAASSQGLNQGQQAAADAFFQFLFSPEKEFNISGPGGYGKTFLMGHLIDVILPRYHDTCKMMGISPLYDEVVMTATTNQAAEELGGSTKRPTSTLASFLNLKVKDDFKTGRSFLTKKENWKVHERKIIFVDECSMVDTALYTALHEGTLNCKIVFVGDHCQLAPVMETLSPVYRQGMPVHTLTQPMRNSGQPALMALCQQLRNTVETGIFQPIRIVPGVVDWFEGDRMQQEVDSHFLHQTHDSRILAYTNARVIEFNDYVRDYRQLPSHYTVGEQLVNNSAVHLKGAMLSVQAEVEILHLADKTEMVFLEQDTELEIRKATIKTKHSTYTDVPLPVDRAHFLALVKYYQKKKEWSTYFFLTGTFPDLRPKDASTFYKAQGSTYDVTFIDLANLSTCNNPDQVARQLYVGATRSKNRIIFFGKLPEKYGGLIFP